MIDFGHHGFAADTGGTFAQCGKCTWWHLVGSPCIAPPRLSDDDVERIAAAVVKKLTEAKTGR
jgi:hypothetical protein